MALTFVDVEISNPGDPSVSERVRLLVDSGAIYSVVPRRILDRLGIRADSTEEFHLADGSTIQRQKGIARFRYGERVGGADVVFGEQGDATLLGALTLEALGLTLDPLRRQLRPLPLMLALVRQTP